MIKENHHSKNYIYIATTTDKYEYIVAMADSMNKLSKSLGHNPSAVSKLLSKHKKNKNMKSYNTYNIERVKIYDFVYVICKDLTKPLYVSRTLNGLAEMSGYKLPTLRDSRYLHIYEQNKLKPIENVVRQFKNGYILAFIDLLDLDINLLKFLESCIDKGQITKSYSEDLESMEEIDVKEEN